PSATQSTRANAQDARGDEMSRITPRVTCPASEVDADCRFCTCCERPLKGTAAWLELDQRTTTYHDFGGVPVDKSQGWFPFGMTCAKNELRKAKAAQTA